MKKITIFGIKNCNTMKKTFQWFDENDIDYDFHDYKKNGACEETFKKALDEKEWNIFLNTRGTTWRKLDDHVKDSMNKQNALKTALQNPSIIKRPLIAFEDNIIIGFDSDIFDKSFK